MNKIYLDHSATTPVDKKVLDAMKPYFSEKFGNPSSVHTFGQEALAGVDKARVQVAQFLNCQPDEIIFTSGATESDNLAIKGVINAVKKRTATNCLPAQTGVHPNKKSNEDKKLHIITSLVEHDAVLEPCMELEQQGVEVSYLPVKANGVVDVEKFKKTIKDNTVLVSVMYVNSEVGSIQPIREIGKIIKKINEKHLRNWKKLRPSERGSKPEPIYFHTDATQAVNFLSCDVKWNYIDLLSLSGHKIYGPKGVGALYVKTRVPLGAVQLGGHHERNLRSGTLNVTGIVGLGAAINQLSKRTAKEDSPGPDNWKGTNKKIAQLRNMLVDGINANIPDVILNTERENATPSHAHFSFLGVEGESILIALDLEGIAVSTGSACASSSLKASHVLLAMGIKKEIAHNSVRFSLGKYNTEAEIQKVLKILPLIIKKLREMNPLYK